MLNNDVVFLRRSEDFSAVCVPREQTLVLELDNNHVIRADSNDALRLKVLLSRAWYLVVLLKLAIKLDGSEALVVYCDQSALLVRVACVAISVKQGDGTIFQVPYHAALSSDDSTLLASVFLVLAHADIAAR